MEARKKVGWEIAEPSPQLKARDGIVSCSFANLSLGRVQWTGGENSDMEPGLSEASWEPKL